MALFPSHSRVNVWGRCTDLQCRRADLLRFPAILRPQLTGGGVPKLGGPEPLLVYSENHLCDRAVAQTRPGNRDQA